MSSEYMKTLTECGARIEEGKLYVGEEAVSFSEGSVRGLGHDGFSIERERKRKKARIRAESDKALVSAFLDLGAMQKEGLWKRTRKLRFTTRNYKHELNLMPGKERSLLDYTEEFWAGVCRELVRRHFNGVVFYVNWTPFERFLDFWEYAEATYIPVEVRRKTLNAFNMILRVSKRYKLRTFTQVYLSEYPARFADEHNLVFHVNKQTGRGRLCSFHHPEVNEYFKYAFRRFFELCPELDGLYLNYESSPTAVELMREVVLPTLSGLAEPPVLFHRLWDFVVPGEMCDLIEMYPGESLVGHKITDTLDVYCYPAADTRIVEWKKAFRKRKLDVEFVYLVGPCHNCGSNVSRRMWSDPEYVYTVLQKAEKLGADGISFHTVYELTSDEFEAATKVIPSREREMARLNHFHLEAAVDFVRGGKFNEKRMTDAHAEHFGLKKPDAAKTYKALRDSSRAEVMHLIQFPRTSQEGYSVDDRRQLSQHPLFYPPVTYFNENHKYDPQIHWSFLNKKEASKPYPSDYQAIIDFVDPKKPKKKQNPEVLAREMQKLGEGSQKAAKPLAKKMGPEFVLQAQDNCHLAVTCARDIRAGIALYRLYFDKSQAQAKKHLKEALKELEAIAKDVKAKGAPYIHMHGKHGPGPDIEALKKLLRGLGRKFPYAAFREFARSKAEYNEIRRFIRPHRIYSEANLKKAASQLKKAKKAAEAALKKCAKTQYEKNVRHWLDQLDRELGWVKPPEMECGPGPGDMQPMVHDNCFGYGSFAWEDFLSFFEPLPFDKGLKQSCGVLYENDYLVIRAHEDGCNMEARLKHWEKFEGAMDPTGFLRILIDTENKGKRLRNWCVFPLGRYATYKEILVRGRQDIIVLPDRLLEGWDAKWDNDASSWTLEFRIPFAQLGGRPKRGAKWGFQVASNAPIKRNHAVAWCRGYEVGPGNPARMGTIVFA